MGTYPLQSRYTLKGTTRSSKLHITLNVLHYQYERNIPSSVGDLCSISDMTIHTHCCKRVHNKSVITNYACMSKKQEQKADKVASNHIHTCICLVNSPTYSKIDLQPPNKNKLPTCCSLRSVHTKEQQTNQAQWLFACTLYRNTMSAQLTSCVIH